MGSAMASVLFGKPRPTVGLLNIGVEEVKGGEEIRKAAEQLRAMNLPELDYIDVYKRQPVDLNWRSRRVRSPACWWLVWRCSASPSISPI